MSCIVAVSEGGDSQCYFRSHGRLVHINASLKLKSLHSRRKSIAKSTTLLLQKDVKKLKVVPGLEPGIRENVSVLTESMILMCQNPTC